MTTPDPPAAPAAKASHILSAWLQASVAEKVTLGKLAEALRDRAFGVVLFLVALVNCVPLPPGVSSLAGVPVFLVGLQMLIGRQRLWLPGFVRRVSVRREALLQRLRTINPYLFYLERICRPRLPWLVNLIAPHLVGAMVVALSLFIMVPLVFTNIPPALAALFLSVALMEKDGGMLALGLLVAIMAMALSATLAAGAVAAVALAAARMFGW
jgi:hypothetical protein